MPSRSFLRLTAVFGLLFTVFSFAAIALQSSGSDVATIVRPTHDEAVRMASTSTPLVTWLGLGIGVAGTGMFLAFATGMAILVRGDEEAGTSWLSRMASAGAVVYVTLTMISLACWATIHERAAHGLDAQGAMLLADLKSVAFFLSWPALAVFLASIGALVRRTALLPAWLGWSGIAIGVLLLAAATAPTADPAQAGGALPFLWPVVVGIVLLLRARRALSPTREAAMMRA
jgi:hypothetical protein